MDKNILEWEACLTFQTWPTAWTKHKTFTRQSTNWVQHFLSKGSSFELGICLRGKTVSTNGCLLSLPLDTRVSVGHNGLVHWFRSKYRLLNFGKQMWIIASFSCKSVCWGLTSVIWLKSSYHRAIRFKNITKYKLSNLRHSNIQWLHKYIHLQTTVFKKVESINTY